MSETIGKLAAALVQVQATMGKAEKDRANPFFKSRYATLDSVVEACREAMVANGLAVAQLVTEAPDGYAGLETVLMHVSGETLRTKATIPVLKKDPQAYGSALTYLRRYALAAAVGVVVEEDDDGNAAAGKKQSTDDLSREVASIKAAAMSATTPSQVDALNGRFKSLPAQDQAELKPFLSKRKAELAK